MPLPDAPIFSLMTNPMVVFFKSLLDIPRPVPIHAPVLIESLFRHQMEEVIVYNNLVLVGTNDLPSVLCDCFVAFWAERPKPVLHMSRIMRMPSAVAHLSPFLHHVSTT